MHTVAEIDSIDRAVVDAEHQEQDHFSDEQETEEKGEAAQRFGAAPLERLVVDLIDEDAEQIEQRQRDDADDDRIDAELAIDDIGDVGAENDETRMRDVDDVEHAE